MILHIDDTDFGCYEPHYDIEFDGNKYRATNVTVQLDDGSIETHIIAEHTLQEALRKKYGEDLDGTIDDEISYYAQANDGVAYIMHCITGEEES